MPVAERTRERSKVYVGGAIAIIGITATITGVVMTTSNMAAEANGANAAVATGTVEGVGFTDAVSFEAGQQAYEVRLVIPYGGGSADTEREARTLTCEFTDSQRRVTSVTASSADVQTLVDGAYPIGRAELAAGEASVQCGWAEPTDADSLRAMSREFEVVPAHPGILESGSAIAFTGFVAFLAGVLAVVIGWKRFRATS